MKGMILNLDGLPIKKPNCRKVYMTKSFRQHRLTQTENAGLERSNTDYSFSLQPAAAALNNIWTVVMRIWVSHAVLHIGVSYLELNLELKMQRVIFLMKSRGTFLNQVKWKGNKFGENEFVKEASLLFFFFSSNLFYNFLCLLRSFCKQPSSPMPSSSALSPTAGCWLTRGTARHVEQLHW